MIARLKPYLLPALGLAILVIAGLFVMNSISRCTDQRELARSSKAALKVQKAGAAALDVSAKSDSSIQSRAPELKAATDELRTLAPKVTEARRTIRTVAAALDSSTADSLLDADSTIAAHDSAAVLRGDLLAKDTADLRAANKVLRDFVPVAVKDDSLTHAKLDKKTRDLHEANVQRVWLWGGIAAAVIAVFFTIWATH